MYILLHILTYILVTYNEFDCLITVKKYSSELEFIKQNGINLVNNNNYIINNDNYINNNSSSNYNKPN